MTLFPLPIDDVEFSVYFSVLIILTIYLYKPKGEKKMKRNIFDRLGYFKWSIHNVIAHPIMEILHLIGLSSLGDKLHDFTIPEPSHTLEHEPEHEIDFDEGHSPR